MRQRTLIIVKPDVMAAGAASPLLAEIERAGLVLVARRTLRMQRQSVEALYAEHRGKDFFPRLVEFMSSGPCLVAVFEGEQAVARARQLVGATDPAQAAPESIRARFGTDLPRNAVHASDSPTDAQREIAFFFDDPELLQQ